MSETTTWEKLPPLDSRANPCNYCPAIPAEAPMGKVIAVGFGSADVTRDGALMLDGEREIMDGREPPTFADAEALAAIDPEHDWRVTLFGPLHGEVYQRQGAHRWLLVESNQGFA